MSKEFKPREFRDEIVAHAEQLVEMLSQDIGHDVSIPRAHAEAVIRTIGNVGSLSHAIAKQPAEKGAGK